MNGKIKLIIILSVTLLLCLTSINILLSYFTAKKAAEISVANNALEIAISIAESMDVAAYERFLENPERNEDYWKIREKLYSAKQNTAALYVYTLAFEDPKSPPKVMIAGFPRDNNPYYEIGMDCMVPLNQIQRAFNGESYFTGKIDDPHYGEYISAGTPIINNQGETIGFLSIDISTSRLDRIGDTVIKNSIPGFILSGLLVIALLTTFVLIQKWYNHELKKQIGDTEETYHTEIQSLITSVRSVRHDFANHIQVLNGLLKLGKHQDALDYSNSMREEAQLLYQIPIRSNNPALSVLFQTKTLAAQSQNIDIHFHHSDSSFEKVLPTDLIKLLSNLVDNAIDAASELPKETRKIEVWCEENSAGYRFTVSNSGPVIPPEVKEKIFTPGFSTKTKNHSNNRVRGQGLYIVKQIVEKYNGRISLESNEERTTFEIRIPS
ncbi:sensor histidine kinase [Bacillus sp. SG-1]|uniref:sensor histidine kinase n=1 Tax=Bacillus sp. SG-1 TaxID=161544 RepID=UPI0001544ABC|nr:ATP-binding protein [Bacillus sp. SG-1]EDL64087.1 signal transduction histidine kinase regulating citrate/malate metabolism [Bacillus sp. SG-1]